MYFDDDMKVGDVRELIDGSLIVITNVHTDEETNGLIVAVDGRKITFDGMDVADAETWEPVENVFTDFVVGRSRAHGYERTYFEAQV